MRRPNRNGRGDLFFESLEERRLLAFGVHCSNATDQATIPFSKSDDFEMAAVFHNASPQQIQSNADGYSAQFFSSSNWGAIDGTRKVSGALSSTNLIDIYQFSIERGAKVQIDLTNLNRNADIFLFDASNRLVGQSTRSGTSNEQFIANLTSGSYTVAVSTFSFRTVRYQLAVAVTLNPIQPPSNPIPPTNPNGVNRFPEVPYFGGAKEWNLNSIGAPESWAAGYTGQGVVVAVIDTGVDLDHPDLVHSLYVNAGEISGNGIDDDQNGFVDDVHGYDFADLDSDPNDLNGHGTHVAGTIAASNNGIGSTGVAPNAKILPVRVLDRNGSGSSDNVAAGIRYAARIGADIINLSLGGGYSRAIELAIDYARSLGTLVVAAAGNESAAMPGFPARFSANYDNVISVGAFNSDSRIASFSNDVGTSRAIQVDAPGVGIFSTYLGGGYATLSGTSMASPHIAGLAALTLSSNPNLSAAQFRELVMAGVEAKATGSDAHGRAQAATTVAYAAAKISTRSLGAGIEIDRSKTSSVTASRMHTLALPIEVSTPEWISIRVSAADNTSRKVALASIENHSFERSTEAFLKSDDKEFVSERVVALQSSPIPDLVDTVLAAANQDDHWLFSFSAKRQFLGV
jgi:subtilisin family serine protease